MEKIVQSKIDAHLSDHLKQWSYTPEGITRDFKFDTFVDAFSFMTGFGIEAEKKDHHPTGATLTTRSPLRSIRMRQMALPKRILIWLKRPTSSSSASSKNKSPKSKSQ